MIYMDHAATTAMRPEVIEAMLPYFDVMYGNASSTYTMGSTTRKAVQAARDTMQKLLGAEGNGTVYFTSGGSESDNWALKGYATKNRAKGRHIITSRIEHHAILHSCETLERAGFEITYLPVDEFGFVRPEVLRAAIRQDTILVSIMFANNEIGTIQNIKELAQIAHENCAVFHTDAVQAVGAIPVNVEELGVDMLSLSAHKFNGPKGIGALYVRNGIELYNLIDGGSQEMGKRAGTTMTPQIVGMAKALELAVSEMDEHISRCTELRDAMISGIMDNLPGVRLNGDPVNRLPGNMNFCFEGVDSEGLLLLLDLAGIEASSGSACTAGIVNASHVLTALGLDYKNARGSLRLSIGYENTEDECAEVVDKVIECVEKLRGLAPQSECTDCNECGSN